MLPQLNVFAPQYLLQIRTAGDSADGDIRATVVRRKLPKTNPEYTEAKQYTAVTLRIMYLSSRQTQAQSRNTQQSGRTPSIKQYAYTVRHKCIRGASPVLGVVSVMQT